MAETNWMSDGAQGMRSSLAYILKEGLQSTKKLLFIDDSFYGIVGKNNKTKEINSFIERIANSRATVLIHGESGTGKRLVAQAIHKEDNKRKHKLFVEISCGALPRELIESELFGHTKGAFTSAINDRKGRFELAHGGTILLDDIDSLSLDLQVKLLRVLQQKEFERVGGHKTIKVDVRIIATTNQNLEQLVAERKFREDLYYRVNVIAIQVPALREIKEDLFRLTNHFVTIYSKENYKEVKNITEEMLDMLTDYDWPGNIRELENIIERAVILDRDGIIDIDDLPETFVNRAKKLASNSTDMDSLKDALINPEKKYILRILKEVGWNKKRAAVKLGINRTTLYNKLRRHNLNFHNSK